MNVIEATEGAATIEVEPNDLHHLIGAMHTLISQHRNLAGSPYGLRPGHPRRARSAESDPRSASAPEV